MGPDLILEQQIKDALLILNPLKLELIDDSHLHAGHAGVKQRGGRHYTLLFSSSNPEFNKLSLIKKHKLIYQALDCFFKVNYEGFCQIHALKIRID